MSRLVGAALLALLAGVACGQSNGDSGSGSNAGQPAAAGQGNAAGSATAGHDSGGNPNSAGGSSAGGGNSNSAGNGVAGTLGNAGNAGQSSGGAQNGGGPSGDAGSGEGGASETDPRPGCGLAAEIEPSNLRVTEGAGPGKTAKLAVDVKNGTSQFVSYNPIKLSCTGAPVQSATALLTVFGISQGESATLQLELTFKAAAKSGDVAHCTVRGFIMNQTPDDCANAPTATIDVKVQ